jgi:hypothetical protein
MAKRLLARRSRALLAGIQRLCFGRKEKRKTLDSRQEHAGMTALYSKGVWQIPNNKKGAKRLFVKGGSANRLLRDTSSRRHVALSTGALAQATL